MSREKQIEETCTDCIHYCVCLFHITLHENKDCVHFRKQSEGEWVVTNNNGFWYYDCPFCDDGYAQETKLPGSNYCANCGAKLSEPKMKGGAE